jgi:hypothetical protein
MRVVTAARALAAVDHMFVLGSAALLVRDARLGEPGGPLELTRDVDLWLDPCDEELAAMLHEAIGQGSLFEQRFGCHVDLLRPEIAATLASGWQARTVEVAGTTVRALAAEDVAAVKLRVGRPKDEAVVAHLFAARLVEPDAVAELLHAMTWTEEEMRQAVLRWGRLAASAR